MVLLAWHCEAWYCKVCGWSRETFNVLHKFLQLKILRNKQIFQRRSLLLTSVQPWDELPFCWITKWTELRRWYLMLHKNLQFPNVFIPNFHYLSFKTDFWKLIHFNYCCFMLLVNKSGNSVEDLRCWLCHPEVKRFFSKWVWSCKR